MNGVEAAILVLASFFVGSLPFGYWICHAKGIDIRTHGSGNIGATNVWRVAGPIPGTLVLLLDILKGAGPSYVGLAMGGIPWGVGCGVAAILGHSMSPFLKFRGGKGVATTLGMLLVVTPVTAGLTLGFWLLLVAATRYVSLASILACLFAVTLVFVRNENPYVQVVFVGLAALIIFRHRTNIRRLIHQEEPKFTIRPPTKPA